MNYYEAACVEIDSGDVDEDEVYEVASGAIIGAYDVVLKRYGDKVGLSQESLYPFICRISKRWRERAFAWNDFPAPAIPS